MIAHLLLFKIVEVGDLCHTRLLHQLAELYPNLAPPPYASSSISTTGTAGIGSRASFDMNAASVRVLTLLPSAKGKPAL